MAPQCTRLGGEPALYYLIALAKVVLKGADIVKES